MRYKFFLLLFASTVVLILSAISPAQIRTVKGNYCGSTMGNRAGTFGFVVGPEVLYLEIEFGSPREVKMVRFNPNRLRVGDEFVIKYDDSGQETKFVKMITGTGKRKKVEPCDME